jgi:hypothetical protein
MDGEYIRNAKDKEDRQKCRQKTAAKILLGRLRVSYRRILLKWT